MKVNVCKEEQDSQRLCNSMTVIYVCVIYVTSGSPKDNFRNESRQKTGILKRLKRLKRLKGGEGKYFRYPLTSIFAQILVSKGACLVQVEWISTYGCCHYSGWIGDRLSDRGRRPYVFVYALSDRKSI